MFTGLAAHFIIGAPGREIIIDRPNLKKMECLYKVCSKEADTSMEIHFYSMKYGCRKYYCIL